MNVHPLWDPTMTTSPLPSTTAIAATRRGRGTTLRLVPLSPPESLGRFATPLYSNGRYSNPVSFTSWTGLPSLTQVLKWMFLPAPASSRAPTDKHILEDTLPVRKPDFTNTSPLSITWLGHATCHVAMDGVSFLTDPVVVRASLSADSSEPSDTVLRHAH